MALLWKPTAVRQCSGSFRFKELCFFWCSLLLSQMTPHWWLLIHTRGQQEVCRNNLWCSIVFCRTEQRGPLLPKGSRDLKANSTDRCGDRDLKPQELEGQPGVQQGGRAPCKLENTGGHGGHFPISTPLLVFNGCSLLGSVVKEIPIKEYIWSCSPQQQSLVCRSHHADRVTKLIPHLSANWPWWFKKDARTAEQCTGRGGGGLVWWHWSQKSLSSISPEQAFQLCL